MPFGDDQPNIPLLARLDLAPLSMVGVETFMAERTEDARTTIHRVTNAQIAKALRILAEGVERSDIDVFDLSVSGVVKPDDIVKHTITMTIAYKD